MEIQGFEKARILQSISFLSVRGQKSVLTDSPLIFGVVWGKLLIIPCYRYTISPQIPRPNNKISFFIEPIPSMQSHLIMSYTIPEITESKSTPNMVAISGFEPEPIANYFSQFYI